jgi:Uma2 family endonuclease
VQCHKQILPRHKRSIYHGPISRIPTISADERDRGQTESIQYPRVIVEVLSPTTEDVDRGKKLIAYRSYPTLEDYILIDSLSKAIEVYHREGKKWVISTMAQPRVATAHPYHRRRCLAWLYRLPRVQTDPHAHIETSN